jgi:dihydrodipicolinate synthase/N-acetylneuraminate lyase
MNQPINGVVPVIPTPFLPNEDIDWESLEHLIDFAIVSGATAICLPAYGSEFYKLSDQERISIVNHAIDAAGGRITVIAQPVCRLSCHRHCVSTDSVSQIPAMVVNTATGIPSSLGGQTED